MAQPLIQKITSQYDSQPVRQWLEDLRAVREEQERIIGMKGKMSAPGGGSRRQINEQTKALKELRDVTALAQIEFQKLTEQQKRGEISAQQFSQQVTALRNSLFKDVSDISGRFEELPRAVQIQVGRSLVQIDRMATRTVQVQRQAAREAERTQKAMEKAVSRPPRADVATRAMQMLRQRTAEARVEFDRLNLANRRGEISNEQFARSVAELRARAVRDFERIERAARNMSDRLPRTFDTALGRSQNVVDSFTTRAGEVLSGRTRLRTRIDQAVQDALSMQMAALPGGRFLLGARLGSAAMVGGGAGLATAAGLAKSIAMAVKYEEALTAVRKTTGMTREETFALGDDLLDLSVKLGQSEKALAAIAAQAGQMGIRGTQSILSFTEAAAKLAAVSDLSADDAAIALGTISNAFQRPISAAENLGSAINELSNETEANAVQIVDALQRVGPAAANLDVSAEAVAGMVATLISLGIESRRAGTQTRNIFAIMQDEAEQMARTIGISGEAFREMIDRDALAALTMYLESLKQLPPQLRTIEILKVFGRENLLSVQAYADSVDEAAGGTGRLSKNIETATRASEENVSLQKELDNVLDSVSGQLSILGQRFKSWGTQFGMFFLTPIRVALKLLNEFLGIMDRVAAIGKVVQGSLSMVPIMGPFVNMFRTGAALTPSASAAEAPAPPGTGGSQAPPPPPRSDAFTLAERIEKLEEERNAIVEVGEATDRLAEINRELNQLYEARSRLQNFGLGDTRNVERASQVLQDLARASELVAAMSTRQRVALERVFQLQEEIKRLEEARRDLGEDAVVEIEGQAVALSDLITGRERELEIERERVREAREFAEFQRQFAQKLQPAAVLPPQAANDTLRQVVALNRLNRLVTDYNQRITKLRNDLDAGRISEREFFKAIENESEAARVAIAAIREALDSVGLLTPELERAFRDAFGELQKGADASEDKLSRLAGTFDLIATALSAIERFADVFGRMDADMRNLIGGTADVFANLSRIVDVQAKIKAGQIESGSLQATLGTAIPAIGIAAGAFSVLDSLRGLLSRNNELSAQEIEELRRQHQAREQLRQALIDNAREIRAAVRDFINAAQPGGQVTGVQREALEDAFGRFMQIFQRGDPNEQLRALEEQRQNILDQLARTDLPESARRILEQKLADIEEAIANFQPDPLPGGVNVAGAFRDFLDAVESLDIPGLNVDLFREQFNNLLESGTNPFDAIEEIMSGGLREIIDRALGGAAFGDSVAGAIAQMNFFQKFLGQEMPEAFKGFIDFMLENVEGLDSDLVALLEEAGKLDLSTEEGRTRLNEIIGLIAGDMEEFLGALTPEELEMVLDVFLQAAGGAAEALEGLQSALHEFHDALSIAQRLGLGVNEMRDRLIAELRGLGDKIDQNLADELEGLDLTTAAGRRRLNAIAEEVWESILEGTTMEDFGLTEEEARAWAQSLDNLGSAADQAADALLQASLKFNDALRFADRLGLDANQLRDFLLEDFKKILAESGREGMEGLFDRFRQTEFFDKLAGLDLTTPEGQEQAKLLGDALAESIVRGTTLEDFGMTREQARQMLDYLDSINARSAEGEGQFSRSVQFVRTITEFQGNELVINTSHMVFRLDEIAKAAKTLVTLVQGLRPSFPTFSMPASLTSAIQTIERPSSIPMQRTFSASFGDITVDRPLSEDDVDWIAERIHDEVRRRLLSTF